MTNTTGSTVSYGATLSSSIEAAFKQDLSFLVDLAEIEVGTSLSAALTYEGATSTEKSVSCEYREVNSLNTIIVARTPMLIYEYELYGNDGSSAPFAVETSGVPHIANITVEEYNEFAEEYNKSGKGDSALPVIGDEFKLGVPGDPFTYRTSFPKSDTACGKIKDQAGDVNTTNYYGSTATEKYIYESKTSENGVSIELGAERFASVGAFGATVKVTNGISGTTGYSTFYTESIGRDGAAGTQIEDSRYDFNWDVGFWDQDGVPVVGYKLSNIKAPTMTPENFSVVKSSITNTEATLTWDVPEFTHGLNPENTYNRTIPNKVRVYVKQNNDEYDEGEYFERDINDGKLELTDLISNKTYTLCIVGYDGLTGNQSRPSQEIRFTTTNVATSHKGDIIAGKGLTRLSSSGAESQTVTGPISAVIY